MGFNYDAASIMTTQIAPFEGFGTQIDGTELDVRDAHAGFERAGLNKTVGIDPMLWASDPTNGLVETVKGKGLAVVRETNTPLGVVGLKHQHIQDSELADMAQAVIDQNADAELVQAGTCDSGARVWAVVGRREPKIVRRIDGRADPIQQLTLLVNDHVGKSACYGIPLGKRLFCGNQIASIVRRATNRRKGGHGIFKLRHSGNMQEKLATAHAMLLEHDRHTEDLLGLYQTLADTRMSLADFTTYAEAVAHHIGGELDDESSDFERNRRDAEIGDLRGLYCEGDGNTGETAWDAANAISDWLDHHRQAYRQSADELKRADLRFQSTTLPTGAIFKGKAEAMEMLLEQVHVTH